jgi:predicted DNA-binding transcriptional regulator YafY
MARPMSDSSGPSEASRLVEDTGRAILRYLRAHPDGAPKGDLARICDVSEVTVQRSLNWLRDNADAPVEYAKDSRCWSLLDRGFTLPLSDPSSDDLSAVVFAGAVLAPLGDPELNARIQRLIEEMDQRVRREGASGDAVRQGSVVATVTTATPVNARVVTVLTAALSSGVVRIRYRSPWQSTERNYEVEPWQLRVHDGAMYLRGYSRTTSGVRTFRVAQIDSARVLDGLPPDHPVPSRDEMWGEGDPAYGIDQDRPGTAVIRVRGAVARWVASSLWHPQQVDHWVENDEVLERTVPYRSCREFARRLLTLGGGLESIEPAALRGEVQAHARRLLQALGDSDV